MAPKGIGDSKLGFTSIFRFHVKHWEGIVYYLLISCYLFLPLKTWISLVRLVSAIEVEESEGQIQEMTLEGADGIVEPLERWMALKQVPSLKLRPYIYTYTHPFGHDSRQAGVSIGFSGDSLNFYPSHEVFSFSMRTSPVCCPTTRSVVLRMRLHL